MRRSTFALLALALSASACTVPGAMRPTRYASFEAPVSSEVPAAPILRHSERHTKSIVKFVKEHRAQLQYCQDLERAANKDFAGSATIEVTHEENGYVLRARVTERSWNADGARIEDCMLTAIRRWDFPDIGPLDEFVHSFTVTLGNGEPAIAEPNAKR